MNKGITKYRKAAGETTQDAAEALGVSRGTVYKIEHGRASITMMHNYCARYGISIDEMVYAIDHAPPVVYYCVYERHTGRLISTTTTAKSACRVAVRGDARAVGVSMKYQHPRWATCVKRSHIIRELTWAEIQEALQ